MNLSPKLFFKIFLEKKNRKIFGREKYGFWKKIIQIQIQMMMMILKT